MIFKDSTTKSHLFFSSFRDFCLVTEKIFKDNKQEKYVICRTNIINFRLFNEMYGTETCDILLNGIAKSLYQTVEERRESIVSYVDNDQFVIFTTLKQVKGNEEKIYDWFGNLTQSVLPDYNISINLGFAEVETSVEKSADNALLALNSIKEDYSKHFAWYDNIMKQKYLEYTEITNTMHKALKNNEFIPYLQPQFDYETGEMIGTEALVRWLSPKKGLITPSKFIPVFEQNGFINDLDRYVLDKVCSYIRTWKDEGLNVPSISINISRRDMYSNNLVSTIVNTLNKYHLSPKDIHIEITESAYMENRQIINEIILNLKKEGFFLEMDDFGSGYSSLLALKDLPFDLLKLDMGFLRETEEIGKSGMVLTSIVRLANQMNLPVLAEGVEEKRQADFLNSIGCHLMQGYLFSKPLPSEEYHDLLLKQKKVKKEEKKIVGILDKSVDFLDVRTQEALLFNSFVGGATILEYRGDKLEMLRTNNQFFEEIGVSKELWKKTNLYSLLTKETYQRFLKMLDKAIETNEEQGDTFYTNGFNKDLYVHVRVRFLAKKVESYIFYCASENVTTEQKLIKTNQELYDSLASVVNNVPCGIIKNKYVNGKLVTIYMNDVYCSMRGYTKQELKELLNEDITACVYYKDAKKLHDAIYMCPITNQGFEMTYRIRHKDGHYLWVNLRTSYDKKGNYLYSYCTDITNDITLKTNLDITQSKLSIVGNTIFGGTALYEFSNGKPKVVEISNGLLELSGYTEEEYKKEFAKNPIFGTFKTDEQKIRNLFDNPEKYGNEIIDYRCYTKDGELIWVNRQSKLIKEEDKTLVHCIYRNLSINSSIYQSIVNEMDSGIIVTDKVTKEILFMNDVTREIYELSDESVVGKKANDVFFDFNNIDKIEIEAEEDYKDRHYYIYRKPIEWNKIDAVVTYISDRTDSYNANTKAKNIIANLPVGLAVFTLDKENHLKKPYFSYETMNIMDFDQDVDNNELVKHERINKDDLARLIPVLNEAKKDFKTFDSEFRIKCRDGSTRWVRIIGKPFYDVVEKQKMFLISYSNITRFKEQEEIIELSEQEINIANSLSSIGKIICYYDINSKTLTSPDSYAKRHGIKPVMTNYPDSKTGNCANVESDKEFIRFYNNINNGIPKGYMETCYVLADGKIAYERAEYITVFDQNNIPKIAVIAIEDSSSIHQAEVRFEEMKRKSDIKL